MSEEITQLIPPLPRAKKMWYQRPWLWILLGLVAIWFGLPLFISLFIGDNNLANNTNSPTTNLITSVNNILATSNGPSLGPLSAPVVLMVFSDFQCPYSRESVPIIKRVLSQYPDTIRFIFRDFPVSSIHSEAVSAAIAANCAFEQGKFWEYHDLLFTYQDDLNTNLYLTLARSLGLAEEKFNNCLISASNLVGIEDDFNAGLAAGVRGTPTFFINGRIVEGSPPYEYWVKIIPEEVRKKFNEF